MKNAAPPASASEEPRHAVPGWLIIPLGLLLILLSAGCSKEKLASLIPKLPKTTDIPKSEPLLSEALLGRWDIQTGKYHYTAHFGRHSEVSMVLDVPAEYRARLRLDQMWLGGNYHVSGKNVYLTFTDGRFSEMMAQLHGLEWHHIVVESFTHESIVDAEKLTWHRIGEEPAGVIGEAHDLADAAPAARVGVPGEIGAGSPLTIAGSSQNSGARIKHLKEQRDKLAAAYGKLDKRRRGLNPKDAKALAAFNKDAADYTRQTAQLNAESNGDNPNVSQPARIPVPAADASAAASSPVLTATVR